MLMCNFKNHGKRAALLNSYFVFAQKTVLSIFIYCEDSSVTLCGS